MSKIEELRLKIAELESELDKCDISTLTGFLIAETKYNELLEFQEELLNMENTVKENSTNPFKDQREFMENAGHTIDKLNYEQYLGLYLNLVDEEYNEVLTAETYPEAAKELMDLIYVCLGSLHSLGIDTEKLWSLVHNHNMLKVTSKPEYDSSGKVKKSEESIKAKQKLMEDIEELIFNNK